MHLSNTLPHNNRIEIADVLRGFAVMGITLIHFIERFSLNSFPEETCNFLIFTDRVIWDSVFFTFSGKAYCIFALLLFIACINSALFPGEILVLYALLGYVLIAVCRLSTRTVTIIAVILLLQPIELGQIIYALINPDYVINADLDAPYWELVNTAQKEDSFLEMCKTAIWTGNVANMGWMLLHGRVTQTAGLFMVGMIIGRSNAFLYSEKNIKIWIKVFIIAVTAFFPIYGLINILPDFISREALLVPSVLLCKSLSNIAFTGIMFAGIILVYYLTTLKNVLHKFAPYGRMSLTNYLSQSLIGGFLFYNWGLGLYLHTGITACILIGVSVFFLQYFFCNWWLRSHRQGPLEWLWKKATWIKVGKG